MFEHIKNPITRLILERLEILRRRDFFSTRDPRDSGIYVYQSIAEYEYLEKALLSKLEYIKDASITNSMTVAASISTIASSVAIVNSKNKELSQELSIHSILSAAMPTLLAMIAAKSGINKVVPNMLKDIRSYAVELYIEQASYERSPTSCMKILNLFKYVDRHLDSCSELIERYSNSHLAFLALRGDCDPLLQEIIKHEKNIDISKYYPFLTLEKLQIEKCIENGFVIIPYMIDFWTLYGCISHWLYGEDKDTIQRRLRSFYDSLLVQNDRSTFINHLFEICLGKGVRLPGITDFQLPSIEYLIKEYCLKEYRNNKLPRLLHFNRHPLELALEVKSGFKEIVEYFPDSLLEIRSDYIYDALIFFADLALNPKSKIQLDIDQDQKESTTYLAHCKTLIERNGFDINNTRKKEGFYISKTRNNKSILTFALECLPFNGDYDFIAYLISRGVNVNGRTTEQPSKSNIDIAIQKESDKILHLLADNGGTIDIPKSYFSEGYRKNLSLEGIETNTLDTILKCIQFEPLKFSIDMGAEEFDIQFLKLPMELREFLAPYMEKGLFKMVINLLFKATLEATQIKYPILTEFKNYDADTIAAYLDRHVPEQLTCAISQTQVIDPVRIKGDVSEKIYERNVIAKWFDSRSGYTQKYYPSTQLPIKGQVTYIPLSETEIKDMVKELHEALDKVQQELKMQKVLQELKEKHSPKYKP